MNSSKSSMSLGMAFYKFRQQFRITLLERRKKRCQEKFGQDYLKLAVHHDKRAEAKVCLQRAVKQVGQINKDLDTCYANIENLGGASSGNVAGKAKNSPRDMSTQSTRSVNNSNNSNTRNSTMSNQEPTNRSSVSGRAGSGRGRRRGRVSDRESVSSGARGRGRTDGRGRGRGGPARGRSGRGQGRGRGRDGRGRGRGQAPGRGQGPNSLQSPQSPSPSRLPKRVDQREIFQVRHSPEGKRIRLSAVNLALSPDEFKPGSQINKWNKSEWKFQEYKTNGGWSKTTEGLVEKHTQKSIRRGIEKFKKYPQLFIAMMYPTEMLSWPEQEQEYTLIYRAGTTGLQPKGRSPKGKVTFLMHAYQPLPSFPNDELPLKFRDQYTDQMTYHGKKLVTKKLPAYLPGRGTGFLDDPRLKVIGDIDPSDIAQGSVGDCWLLSGIASLAEFDGAVQRLFRKTKDLDQMPFADGRPNQYTITLWNLPTWTEVDIVIDERLPARPDIKGALFGAKASADGELWLCYLEKAIAAHCGGWDKIDGGQCTHAWSLLTGCKEQYVIQRIPEDPANGPFAIWAKYDPTSQSWAKHGNSPSDGQQGVWRVPWPKVGGGGSDELDEEELFSRLCVWNGEHFLIGASSKGDSDRHNTNGVVDNHAYSVIDCRSNVARSGFDLIQVRNPWGYGGIENGMFAKQGRGWKEYPEIQDALEYKELEEDDGVFWVTKEEFFQHYQAIYLGALDMKKFLGISDGNRARQVPIKTDYEKSVAREREARIRDIPPVVFLSSEDDDDDDGEVEGEVEGDDDDDNGNKSRENLRREKAVDEDNDSSRDGNDSSDDPSNDENSNAGSGKESESDISETISLVSEKRFGEPSGIRTVDGEDDDDDDDESEESPIVDQEETNDNHDDDDDDDSDYDDYDDSDDDSDDRDGRGRR